MFMVSSIGIFTYRSLISKVISLLFVVIGNFESSLASCIEL
jgi:hypothetical protein